MWLTCSRGFLFVIMLCLSSIQTSTIFLIKILRKGSHITISLIPRAALDHSPKMPAFPLVPLSPLGLQQIQLKLVKEWLKEQPTLLRLCCCLVAQSCQTLYSPMDCSRPVPVPHHLPKFAQVHVHCISDAIQPSHPLRCFQIRLFKGH